MEATKIRVWPTNKHPSVLANGSVTFDNVMSVKFTVFKGSKGMFVGFPGKYGEKTDPETGKKPWYSDVTVFDKAFNAELTKTLLEAYNKTTNNSLDQGEAPGPTNQSTDSCPF